jgi:peroxin-5
MNAQRDELEDYGTDMQNSWEGGLGNYDDNISMQFDTEGIPLLGPYLFGRFFKSKWHFMFHVLIPFAEKSNKYMDPSSSRSLLTDAKVLLDNNGSLSEAALMLEAAIQQEELGEGGYESWVLLGETRNMDEREEAGMRALLQGVKRAEELGTPGAGMLVSLAEINFTSNLISSRASLPSLWLYHSPMNLTTEHPTLCYYVGLGLTIQQFQFQRKL